MDPLIDSAQLRQSKLDRAKAAFFAAGGKIHNLGEYQYVQPLTHSLPAVACRQVTRRRINRANDQKVAASIRDLANSATPTVPMLRNVFEVRNLLRAEGS